MKRSSVQAGRIILLVLFLSCKSHYVPDYIDNMPVADPDPFVEFEALTSKKGKCFGMDIIIHKVRYNSPMIYDITLQWVDTSRGASYRFQPDETIDMFQYLPEIDELEVGEKLTVPSRFYYETRRSERAVHYEDNHAIEITVGEHTRRSHRFFPKDEKGSMRKFCGIDIQI